MFRKIALAIHGAIAAIFRPKSSQDERIDQTVHVSDPVTCTSYPGWLKKDR